MKKAHSQRNPEIVRRKVSGIEDWKSSGLGGDAQVVQMAPGLLSGEIFHAILEGAAISSCWINQPLHHRGPVTSGAITFSACLNAAGETIQRGVSIQPGHVLVHRDDSERDTLHSGHYYRYFTLAIPAETADAYVNIYAPEKHYLLESTSVYRPTLRQASFGIKCLNEAAAILQAVESNNHEGFDAKIFALSVLSCFLEMLPDEGGKIDCPYPSGDRRLIREVEELVRSDDAAIAGVPGLCLSLGISRRTLERAFQRALDMSPAHYLTLFRLCRAREDLVSHDDTVASIAMKHGFYELGRFSQRYKSLFGEFPSETRAANRNRRGPTLTKESARSLTSRFGKRMRQVA